MSSETPPLEETAPGAQGNQLRFVIDVVLRHWVMLIVFSSVAAFVGGIIGNLLRDESFQYEAVADLVVRQSPWDQPAMSGVVVSVFGRTTPKALKERVSMNSLMFDVVRSLVQEDVGNGGPLANVTEEREFQDEAARIGRLVQLDDLNEAGILRVRVRGDDAWEVERIAETTARVLVEHTRDHQREEQDQAHDLVQERLQELRDELDEAERNQWAFREEVGFLTRDQVWVNMEKKDDSLAEAKTRRASIKTQLLEIESSLKRNSEDLPNSLGNVSETTVIRLINDLEDLLGEKVELMVDWLPGSPGMAMIEEEIQSKQEAVEIAINELNAGKGGASGLWGKRQDLYRQQVNLEFELSLLDQREASLEAELKAMVADLPELADQSFRYEQLSHEVEQVRKQFDRMLGKEFEIKTARDRGAASVERRNAVAVTHSLTGRSTSIWTNVLLGGFIGFVIGFALAMMWEMMDTSIKDVDDVTKYIGLEVIGMIPLMKFGKPRGGRKRRRGAYVVTTDEEQVDACIVTQHDPKSPISEAYRSFRTNFQFATLHQNPGSVMITSAVPGEGKTTTTVNFAVTMADRGMRVLIVDTDLRRPNVHRVLKMERGPGLADVLRERIPVKTVIRETSIENLWIISSGRVPPNPSELIGSERMNHLMVELGKSFDLVVCDAPSVLVVTDPVLLATQVDTTVLVISANNARRETIIRAKALLETANSSIAGVVLNGLEATRRHYYYYYYYYDDAAAAGRRRWYQNI